MRERLERFMVGRYGTDDYTKFLLGSAVGLAVLNLFLRVRIFNFLVLVLLVYVYVRMFSRNIQRRYEENRKYLGLKQKFLGIFQREKRLMQERRTHHIYRCPKCGQRIRIPRGKGKICITCPKCRTEFTKKS